MSELIEKLEAGPVPDDVTSTVATGPFLPVRVSREWVDWTLKAGPMKADPGRETTLGGMVQLLESEYADLHTMAGELLATLTVSTNRALILAGDVDALARLMGFVDGWKTKYGHFPRPGAAFTGG